MSERAEEKIPDNRRQRPPVAGSASAPSGIIALWAILVPITYAPHFLIGIQPSFAVILLCTLSCAAAALAAISYRWTAIPDGIEPRVGSAAGWLLALVIAAYVGASAFVSHAKLADFRNYDQLSLFCQSYWTALHGHPFSNTAESIDGSLISHFGVHFSPTLLVLAPFYRLWPSPLLILIGQAAALALTTVPLYHLAKGRVGRSAALVFALLFLALPNFAWGGIRDFHDSNFLPVLLVTAVWAIENRRWKAFTIAAVAALGVREEMGFTLLVLAVYALIRGRGLKAALGIAGLGLAWMLVAIKIVMPHFWQPDIWIDPSRFFRDVFGHWGATPLEAVRGAVGHPVAFIRAVASDDTARYLYHLLTPFLLVPPLLNPASIIGVPSLAINVLSRLPWMRDASLYYSIVPITFAAVGSIETALGVARRAAESRRAAAGFALAVVLLAGAVPMLPLTVHTTEPPAPPPDAARAVVGIVPPGAPVYCPRALCPALCNREYVVTWANHRWKEFTRDTRIRFQYFVLWPDGDPEGQPYETALVDSLARDTRFREVTGFAPFTVFERR
jgi:uncharacterized membrane protein